MSLRTAFRNFWDPPEYRSATATIVVSSQAGKPKWPARSPEVYDREAFRKIALIFRCVGHVASAASAAPLRVYDEPDHEPIDDHPMRRLMIQPNAQMRESRFTATLVMMLVTAGFAVIEKERDRLGNVIGLWLFEPNRLRAIPRSQQPPDWEYTISASNKPILKAADVIALTYADTIDLNPFGIGPLEACLREVGLLNEMTDFLKAFFEGGAMPVYGLVPDPEAGKVDQAKADAIREKWVRRHSGLTRSVEPAILTGIKDVKRLSFDFGELAFTDLRDLSDLAICQAFGVPPGLVGARLGIERNTFSNATEMRRSFYEDTIAPLWARIDDALTLGLLSEFDTRPNIAIQFDSSAIPALQEDRNAKATWIVQATLGGAMTVHTMHAELGIDAPEGDDFFLRPISAEAVPVTDPLGLEAIARDEAMRKELAAQQAKALPVGNDASGDVPQDPTADDAARAWRVIREQRGRVSPREMRKAIGTVNRRHIVQLGRKTSPWVRDYFTAAGDRVAGSIRAGGGPNETRADAVDWDREEKELAKILKRVYVLGGETATEAVNEQLGLSLSWDLANPKLADVRQLLASRVTGVTVESQRVIQDLITAGTQSGKTIDELAADIRGKFGEWSQGRAVTIARTESATAYNSASALQYRESGVVSKAELMDNPDHDTDPLPPTDTTCAQRNGMQVGLDQVDDYIASCHPNCVMAVAPIVGED